MAYPTLADIAARTGSDAVIGLIEDVTTYAPEFSIFPAAPKPGTSYLVTRRVALPTPAFRGANDPVTITKNRYEQEVKQMYYLDVQLQADEAVVKADTGALGNFLTQEAQGALQAAVQHIGSQIWYGTNSDAKGFTGLLAQSVGKLTTGGTSSSTSAYLVWMNPQGVQLVVGNDGAIDMPEWVKQAIQTATNKQHMAWVSNLASWIGLQVGSNQAVWRVAGITKTAGAGLTDARGEALLAEVPLVRRNGLRWFMNRRAAFTLQASRTAITNVAANSGGSPAFPPTPTELAGVPITITDSLTNSETNSGSADTYAEE
jgi:hypothetical protein